MELHLLRYRTNGLYLCRGKYRLEADIFLQGQHNPRNHKPAFCRWDLHRRHCQTIRRRYQVGIYYFFNNYAPLCERWILADNSQIPFRVIAEGSKDDLINIKDEETYARIHAIAEDKHRSMEENGEILSL